jgi:hypothetical protein
MWYKGRDYVSLSKPMNFLPHVLWLASFAATDSSATLRHQGWGGVLRNGRRSFARTPCSRPLTTRLKTACATWLLPLLLLTPLAALQAQLTYVTNNGTITITGCTGISGAGATVVIPDRLPDPTNGLPVTAIGGYAFSSLSVTNVIIPNSVVSIGGYAFDGCKALGKVIIGNSVTTIGDYAFQECGLRNVIIPNSVISIGDYAFAGCAGLTNVIIPNKCPHHRGLCVCRLRWADQRDDPRWRHYHRGLCVRRL